MVCDALADLGPETLDVLLVVIDAFHPLVAQADVIVEAEHAGHLVPQLHQVVEREPQAEQAPFASTTASPRTTRNRPRRALVSNLPRRPPAQTAREPPMGRCVAGSDALSCAGQCIA